MQSNILTERDSSLYHGIKKLWQSEVEFWRTATMPEYYLYSVPNSIFNVIEYYLVENPGDLATLRQYLKDGNRIKDFDGIQEIRSKNN